MNIKIGDKIVWKNKCNCNMCARKSTYEISMVRYIVSHDSIKVFNLKDKTMSHILVSDIKLIIDDKLSCRNKT